MKPSLEMEKAQLPSVVLPPENTGTERKGHAHRWIIGSVLGLVAVVVVASVVLVTVHLTAKVTRENYKEAIVTFHDSESNRQVREKVVVTETEEDVEVPDEIRIIFDYRQHLMAILFDAATDEDDAVCYITPFNSTSDTSIDNIRQEMAAGEIDRSVPIDEAKHVYESTEEVVDPRLLSPRTQDMCRGYDIFWAKETVESEDSPTRRKRGCSYSCTLSCSWRGCTYSCRLHCGW